VEHTLFKGTSKMSSSQINNSLERLGGELDAYTTKEEIVLHATVLKEDLHKAASLILDLAVFPTFPEDEIATEKGVVIDEILSYRDSPSDDIMDCFDEKLFPSHPLGRRVLGTPESVNGITSEELHRFVRENFTPDRMALSIVAPMDEDDLQKEVESLAEKYFGSCAPSSPILSRGAAAPSLPSPFVETLEKGNHEANAVIGGFAPSLESGKERFPMILLCNMLGGPASNSILNNVLREKNGWVYSVEASYVQYEGVGEVTIGLGCDRANVKKCIAAVYRELSRLGSTPISPRRLAWARKQLLGQQAIAMEMGEAQCLSMGKSLLSFGKVASDDEIRSFVEEIDSASIQAAASKWLERSSLCELVYL